MLISVVSNQVSPRRFFGCKFHSAGAFIADPGQVFERNRITHCVQAKDPTTNNIYMVLHVKAPVRYTAILESLHNLNKYRATVNQPLYNIIRDDFEYPNGIVWFRQGPDRIKNRLYLKLKEIKDNGGDYVEWTESS